jgi:hypothetical protein
MDLVFYDSVWSRSVDRSQDFDDCSPAKTCVFFFFTHRMFDLSQSNSSFQSILYWVSCASVVCVNYGAKLRTLNEFIFVFVSKYGLDDT